ncbi:hypothetical protein OM076_29050 [Solirubrobacter ginsenosidimutans]|uniref:Uncharacterized protein n=1 Tax=Solirubrobacter ginsenosidimutans TaxID=490573 RepID=A0A9X3S8K5_9ACTN|nr:hypothetical protein [Solirubrobacter ginsenosidimutans]MDA0164353.1 hypothetical protein [Solirubrobacter ginsenosidimutans]
MLDDRELDAPQPITMPATVKVDPVCFWLAVASALGVIIGAVGPWTTAWGMVQVSGTGMHGWREVAVGVVALALLAVHRRRGGALELLLAAADGVVGASGAAVALSKINANDTLSVLGFHYTFLDPAWGIYLVLGGAILLTCCASTLAWRSARRARSDRRPRATYSSGSTPKTVLETDDGSAPLADH